MRVTLPKALLWVRNDEGGNSDDPQDHGGRTSRGITQREFDAWRAERSMAPLDVFLAPDSQIDSIYLGEYWEPEGDWMPQGLDYAFFDLKVNAGPGRSIKTLQRALGVADDGRLGPVTRQAITQTSDLTGLLAKFNTERERFYRSLGQPRFLRGWLSRSERVYSRALTLINNGAAK